MKLTHPDRDCLRELMKQTCYPREVAFESVGKLLDECDQLEAQARALQLALARTLRLLEGILVKAGRDTRHLDDAKAVLAEADGYLG